MWEWVVTLDDGRTAKGMNSKELTQRSRVTTEGCTVENRDCFVAPEQRKGCL
ncbi:unnamed protein product [Chondrus crispus]|uniref:Uncharacterized protein n=1 Tax=Chondrus crispus TaxID=2769 RepID=R7QML0_CHOCR|nr:unnamed protein product [Chondrus crispus]CDF38721.1 unnamed protein product [Chondrus crispus]|eukprot:XP_005718626.1 unnamed protein product [Chondrus crispus]